jgi:hypothetical protein
VFGDGAAYHSPPEERIEDREPPDMEPHVLLCPHEPHRMCRESIWHADVLDLKMVAEHIDPTRARCLSIAVS